ncbi:MAG TPA: hypothetical protein VGV60_15775 [Candidatus Polarisedimenticolia bacterium]|nr:hypothetical protein [Candidatus Polarisedimenticolia bacterium]
MPSGRLACLTLGVTLLLLCPAGAPAAEDQKPPPAQSDEQRKAEERKKAEEQERADERKSAQERQQAREKAPAAAPKSAPLRFTDDDLEAFHKRPPASADEAETDEEDEASSPPVAAPPAPAGAGVRPPAPPAPPKGPRPVVRPVVRPPGIAPRPQDDPLKPFRDREAKEKFRTEQIQKMRDRLAAIDKRLEYLNARKLGVLDPLVGMPAPQPGDDAQGQAALRPKDLLEAIDREIKGLEQEKEQVQADLVSIETRFAQESQSR